MSVLIPNWILMKVHCLFINGLPFSYGIPDVWHERIMIFLALIYVRTSQCSASYCKSCTHVIPCDHSTFCERASSYIAGIHLPLLSWKNTTFCSGEIFSQGQLLSLPLSMSKLLISYILLVYEWGCWESWLPWGIWHVLFPSLSFMLFRTYICCLEHQKLHQAIEKFQKWKPQSKH